MPKNVDSALLVRRDSTAPIDAIRRMDQVLLWFKRRVRLVESAEEHRTATESRIAQLGRAIPHDVHVSASSDRDAWASNVADRNRRARNGVDSNGIRKTFSVFGPRIEEIALGWIPREVHQMDNPVLTHGYLRLNPAIGNTLELDSRRGNSARKSSARHKRRDSDESKNLGTRRSAHLKGFAAESPHARYTCSVAISTVD